MMRSWPKVRLDELISLEYGKALKAEDRVSSGRFPVYGSNGVVGTHNQALFDEPTIIVGRKGAVGEAHIAMNGCWPIDTAFYSVIRQSGVVSLRYLLHWFKSLDLKSMVITATIPGLNRSTLYSLLVPLPPLAEQERIVALLDEADALRKLRAQADQRTADLIPALFHDMFGDPATNPMGWPTVKLHEAGRLDRGRSKYRPRNDPRLFGGNYPFIQTGDVANSSGIIATFSQTYSEEGLRQSRLWPAGTLCITIAANIGKTAILSFPACFPDSIVGLTPGRTFTVEYLAMVRHSTETTRGVSSSNGSKKYQLEDSCQFGRSSASTVLPKSVCLTGRRDGESE